MTLFKVVSFLLCILALVSVFMLKKSKWPEWALDPCPRCEGEVRWLKGQDSNSTAEARFECNCCHLQQYRGGMGSELTMEQRENETTHHSGRRSC